MFLITVIFLLANLFLMACIPVVIFLRIISRGKEPKITKKFQELPLVTIQLPICNEKELAKRILLSVSEVDYPKERLYIQALDDSFDGETSEIVKETVNSLKQKGFDVDHITRKDRTGYKAGNLQNALPFAKGDYVAIFDCDVLIPKEFFNKTIHYFTDSNVCFVQTRWSNSNSEDNFLTKMIGFTTDAEFSVFQAGYNWQGFFITFNGSGGVWRIKSIEDVGGWSLDTLGEDRDLSYRCYLKGMRAVYVNDVEVPHEIPSTLNSIIIQRSRWSKATADCNFKYLKQVLLSERSILEKIVLLHLMLFQLFMSPVGLVTHILVVLFLILVDYGFFPDMQSMQIPVFGFYLLCFYGFLYMFLVAGQIVLKRGPRLIEMAWQTVVIQGVSFGISLYLIGALFEGMAHKKAEFKTTPKTGTVDKSNTTDNKEDADRNNQFKLAGIAFAFSSIVGLVLFFYTPISLYLILFLILNWGIALYSYLRLKCEPVPK